MALKKWHVNYWLRRKLSNFNKNFIRILGKRIYERGWFIQFNLFFSTTKKHKKENVSYKDKYSKAKFIKAAFFLVVLVLVKYLTKLNFIFFANLEKYPF